MKNTILRKHKTVSSMILAATVALSMFGTGCGKKAETDNTKPSFIANKPDLTNYQVKPSSGVATGKVLTYTGNNADANVAASYITVPVATAAPSTVTPTGFVEMWVTE